MTRESMLALVFDHAAEDGSATRVATTTVPRPGAGQVSIAVSHAGINFKDVMSRRGDPGYVPSWPFIPGLEVAGTVRKVGIGVTQFSRGDLVLALTNAGGLAEVAVAESALTVAIPVGVEAALAAAVPGAFTTAELLLNRAARLRAGDVLLVQSAGGSVGRAIADIARLQPGVRLIGVVGSDRRLATALDAGYDAAFTRDSRLAANIRDHLGGRGVDVVLDPQGTTWLDQDLQVLEVGGTVVIFGNAAGVAISDLPPLGQLFARNVSIGGFSLAALSRTAPDIVAAAMNSVLAHLRHGRLAPSVTVLDGLERAAEAQQSIADGIARSKQIIRLRS